MQQQAHEENGAAFPKNNRHGLRGLYLGVTCHK